MGVGVGVIFPFDIEMRSNAKKKKKGEQQPSRAAWRKGFFSLPAAETKEAQIEFTISDFVLEIKIRPENKPA